MTDEPNDRDQQPRDLPVDTPGQGVLGQSDAAASPVAEAARPAEPPGQAVTEAPAPQPPPEAETTKAGTPETETSELEKPEAETPAAETPEAEPPEAEAPEAEISEAETSEAEMPDEGAKSENMDWYILKVQSNREDSIREGLLRRVAIAGLEPFFGEVIVPTEKVTEFKGGKKRVTKRKLYPGYLVVQMEINDDTWFLVRETPGIGDFTGAAGRPTPMLPHEVARILVRQEEKSEKAPKLKIGFNSGDQVKITDGTFESFEGEVENIDQTSGRVTVMINIFGRSTPVELEYWQVETV